MLIEWREGVEGQSVCTCVCVRYRGTILSSNFIQIQGHQYCNRRCKPLREGAPP